MNLKRILAVVAAHKDLIIAVIAVLIVFALPLIAFLTAHKY